MSIGELVSHLGAAVGGGILWQALISTVLKDRTLRYLKKRDEKQDREKVAMQFTVEHWPDHPGTVAVTNCSSSRLTGVRAELTVPQLSRSGLRQEATLILDESRPRATLVHEHRSIHSNRKQDLGTLDLDSAPLAWVDATDPAALIGKEIALNNEERAHVSVCGVVETRHASNYAPDHPLILQFASEKGTSRHYMSGDKSKRGAGYIFVVIPKKPVKIEGTLTIKSNQSTTVLFPFVLDVDGQTGELSLQFSGARIPDSK